MTADRIKALRDPPNPLIPAGGLMLHSDTDSTDTDPFDIKPFTSQNILEKGAPLRLGGWNLKANLIKAAFSII